MSEFIQSFIDRGEISFNGLRNTAIALLPTDKIQRDQLYNDLERGKGVLDDDDHLNMYLFSFGKMHEAKLGMAFESFKGLSSLLGSGVEIYDWGCGQGTATICLLDYIRQEHLPLNIRSITLVDPSTAAVGRAHSVLGCYGDYAINTVTKGFDELGREDFTPSRTRKLHLFSNILDVDRFDLARYIYLFQQTFDGDNYFLCVGPYYSNSRRLDDFIAATDPDEIYAVTTKERGQWLNDWTLSLRIFYKSFSVIEPLHDIRKRIEESHKKEQFFAGFILDAVSEEYVNSDKKEETAELFEALSSFDVKSSVSLGSEEPSDPKLAVLANIISRGLPTKAPILLENLFSDFFGISEKPSQKSPVLEFASTHQINADEIFKALHVIDPRFDPAFYNGDLLESNFEKEFIEHYLPETGRNYLIQLLEPQRPLSTLVDIPDRRFSKDQRVDFALELSGLNTMAGFIVELDGQPYHSSLYQRLRDKRRDRITAQDGWTTNRIDNLRAADPLRSWENDEQIKGYLSIFKENMARPLEGRWLDTLQVVLSPLAVARVERILIEAVFSGALSLSSRSWDIVIVERDVPCGAIAVEDFKTRLSTLSQLEGAGDNLPDIKLTIVSTKEFASSRLHCGNPVLLDIPDKPFDLCIDISMLLRDNIDALPLRVESGATFIARSSHYKKRERTICSATHIQYPAFVTKDDSGSYRDIPERRSLLEYFLQDIFRKRALRPGQLPILSRALSDKTTIGLLPTGGGKSLTYQLSCMLQPGVAIVVDPLVSLMVDQIRGLRNLRIDASECVHSGMDIHEKARKLNRLQDGNVLFMMLSPERFMMKNFRLSLSTMTDKNHVYFSYGVIDEVHCVSEWGHDFRTSYLHLGRNMINYMQTGSGRSLPVIGLTATASFDVLADVERELTLGGALAIDSETIVRPEDDTRPELQYKVLEVTPHFEEDQKTPFVLASSSERDIKNTVSEAKRRTLSGLLRKIPNDIERINNNDGGSCHLPEFDAKSIYRPEKDGLYRHAGLVFCPHRRGAFGVEDNEQYDKIIPGVASFLRSQYKGLSVGTFVGGDNPEGDMKLFNDNKLNMMVATKAFGMGIDKPNIRFGIHINHPSSIESYVQEAGRAGRDQGHAVSYILYDSSEYIILTPDKVNDIRFEMGANDPVWLENYLNKIVLLEDLPDLCRSNGTPEDQTQAILQIIRGREFSESVDKDIVMFFHNNSFRGQFKEEMMLKELTWRILNASPTMLLEVQNRLRDESGFEDVAIKLDKDRGIRIQSKESPDRQYGYLFLDNLNANYNYRCQEFRLEDCIRITEQLISILSSYKDHSATALRKPAGGVNNVSEGIFGALEEADENGYIYVTVTWENQLATDLDDYESRVLAEIGSIASTMGWNSVESISLRGIDSFEDLLSRIARASKDTNWLRYHGRNDIFENLKKEFCRKRDKDDTDKAIYRMCCMGLVEDVTIDYLSESYELKIKKRSDEEFQKSMMDFFLKYYSPEQATLKVQEIDSVEGKNYMEKCLAYLTRFIYSSLKTKRYRAIEDMRFACEQSLEESSKRGNELWLKEFIHLYFNSKYARTGYQVNGQPYSLTEDTDAEGRNDFNIVSKYICIMMNDPSGSEIENVKHLYGATLLCLRAHPDNSALNLLRAYCIVVLGAGSNDTLRKAAYDSYLDGFLSLYEKSGADVWDYIDTYNGFLKGRVNRKDKELRKSIIEQGKETLSLLIHSKKLKGIAESYLK